MEPTDYFTEGPFISLQCDWDDVILLSNQKIWISSLIPGKKSTHSKILTHGTNLPSCDSNDFSVLFFTQKTLGIKYNPTEHLFIFLAPSRTYSNIHEKTILSLDVSSKGYGISVSTDDVLVIWNLFTGEIMKNLSGHLGNVYKCKFFPSETVILSCGADMQIKIWSAESGICPVTLTGHRGAVTDFCIVERGRNIISVSKDGTSKLWDCGKSECLATIFESNSTLNCCSLGTISKFENISCSKSANDREIGTSNKLLVLGSEEGFIYGIDVFNRKRLFSVLIGSSVNLVILLSDKVVVGCQNGDVKIYQLFSTEVPIKVFSDSKSSVVSGCSYKENGVLVGRNDGSVIYYDVLNYSSIKISLTGSNCDPITDICCRENKIYTCCRDGKIRQYSIDHLVSKYFKDN